MTLKPFIAVLALGLTATAVGAGFYLQHDVGPEDAISWGGLQEHVVQPGETAEVIAAIYGVDVSDLQAWNGKKRFEPGDKVAIFAREGGDDPAMDIEIKSALAELELQVREGKTITRKAPKGSVQKVIPVLVAELTVSGGPPAPAPRTVPAPKGQGKRVQMQGDMAALETMRGLNKKMDLSGPEKVASNSRYSSGATNDAIRDMFAKDRGSVANTAAKVDAWSAAHSNGNTAPAPERTSGGSTNDYQSYAAFRAGQERDAAPVPPKLSMPAAKKCLAGPSDVAEGNGGMSVASNVGLSEPAIRSAMSRFVPKALSCVSGASRFDGTVETEITVGCDGRVTSVSIEHNDGVPQAVAACLRDTLRYAPFPAHDMPDGYTFGYRVNLSR